MRGEDLVSRGVDWDFASTTKQSSTLGSSGPNVNFLLGVMLSYGFGPEVGIPPSSTGK